MLLTQMVVIGEIHVFVQLAEQAFLEQKKPLFTMKIMICRKYSGGKLTQFSQGNIVLCAAASKMDGFLWSETCVSSTQLNRHIAANRTYPHFEKYDLQEIVLSKTNFILKWRQCGRCLHFNHRYFSV
jgi:hypothetical protein